MWELVLLLVAQEQTFALLQGSVLVRGVDVVPFLLCHGVPVVTEDLFGFPVPEEEPVVRLAPGLVDKLREELNQPLALGLERSPFGFELIAILLQNMLSLEEVLDAVGALRLRHPCVATDCAIVGLRTALRQHVRFKLAALQPRVALLQLPALWLPSGG